jgi:hypothetical protein
VEQPLQLFIELHNVHLVEQI